MSESFEVKSLRVRIVQDEEPESPREWSNLGVMVYWHRRYILGDVDGSKTYESPRAFIEEAEEKGSVILPLYLYDHSGLTMNTRGFHCPWDSGQVGHIYATAEAIRKEYGVTRISKQLRAKVAEVLKSEVNAFDQYLRGDVYGFVIEDAQGNHLDSCWGFFGFEYAKEEATQAAQHQAAKIAHMEESIAKTFAL